jgi:hypothetical protein
MARTCAVASTALCVLTGLTGCGGQDDDVSDLDVVSNKGVLATLPELPGARRLETTSSPSTKDDGATVTGYGTSIGYEAPEGTSDRDVIRFYSRATKPDWRCEVERSDIIDLDRPRKKERPMLVLSCHRGKVGLSINTDSMPRFDVAVSAPK